MACTSRLCNNLIALIVSQLQNRDQVMLGLTSKRFLECVRLQLDMTEAMVMAEVRPYVLRAIADGKNKTRFAMLDHRTVFPTPPPPSADRLHSLDWHLRCQFRQGMLTVYKFDTEPGLARTSVDRRDYITTNFRGADALCLSEIRQVVSELTDIVSLTESECTRTTSEGFRQAFIHVLRAKEAAIMNPHDRSLAQVDVRNRMHAIRAVRLDGTYPGLEC